MRAQTLVRAKQTIILFFSFFFLFLFSVFSYSPNSHMEIDPDIAGVAEMKSTADDSLGDLQLGRVRQQYILDPDLRGILSCAVLDADKMTVYEDRELFLMTSVVYSENCEVVGKRMQEVCTLSPPLLWMAFRVSLFAKRDG